VEPVVGVETPEEEAYRVAVAVVVARLGFIHPPTPRQRATSLPWLPGVVAEAVPAVVQTDKVVTPVALRVVPTGPKDRIVAIMTAGAEVGAAGVIFRVGLPAR
jgi:hypothetical protein